MVGGVAANSRVRALGANGARRPASPARPGPRLCTDNGAMIAAAGDLLVRAGVTPDALDLAADPSAVLRGALLHGPREQQQRLAV